MTSLTLPTSRFLTASLRAGSPSLGASTLRQPSIPALARSTSSLFIALATSANVFFLLSMSAFAATSLSRLSSFTGGGVALPPPEPEPAPDPEPAADPALPLPADPADPGPGGGG